MVLYLDYTSPDTRFTFDVNKSKSVAKDHRNFINVLGILRPIVPTRVSHSLF